MRDASRHRGRCRIVLFLLSVSTVSCARVLLVVGVEIVCAIRHGTSAVKIIVASCWCRQRTLRQSPSPAIHRARLRYRSGRPLDRTMHSIVRVVICVIDLQTSSARHVLGRLVRLLLTAVRAPYRECRRCTSAVVPPVRVLLWIRVLVTDIVLGSLALEGGSAVGVLRVWAWICRRRSLRRRCVFG